MYPVTRAGRRVTISALIALCALVSTVGAVLAQSQVTVPPRRPAPAQVPALRPTPAAPSEATPAPAGPVVAEVTGFRSAHFGMTEPQVRAAIERDLRARPDDIRSEENKAEQTQVLVVRAADVLPGGGTADISYVFGFKSKTLIQVGLSWSKATDDKMTPEQLFSNANVLRAHFLEAGYKPDTISTNMPVNNGILLFRGSDIHDRTTVLVLQGTFSQGENNQRVLTPTALLLFYIADAKSPDVYRLPPGSF
jgi:hypothetical protein